MNSSRTRLGDRTLSVKGLEASRAFMNNLEELADKVVVEASAIFSNSSSKCSEAILNRGVASQCSKKGQISRLTLN
jgi:hypothetical protein